MSESAPQSASLESNLPPSKLSLRRRVIRWLGRIFLLFVAAIAFYALSVWVLGRIPVNRDFEHADSEGVEILLINNGVHADLVVPLNHPSFPMMHYLEHGKFGVARDMFEYAIIGWGSRKFYLETETWDDLRVSTVGYALSGFDRTTVHVRLFSRMDWPTDSSRMIRIRPDQFAKLGEHIASSFRLDNVGRGLPIAGAHYRNDDAFFEGQGNYNLFRTCNVWVGQGLKKAGVRVGVWTVTPKALFASLPEDARRQPTP
jgi:uncharacterized protein (TIGR02117 family)